MEPSVANTKSPTFTNHLYIVSTNVSPATVRPQDFGTAIKLAFLYAFDNMPLNKYGVAGPGYLLLGVARVVVIVVVIIVVVIVASRWLISSLFNQITGFNLAPQSSWLGGWSGVRGCVATLLSTGRIRPHRHLQRAQRRTADPVGAGSSSFLMIPSHRLSCSTSILLTSHHLSVPSVSRI